MKKNKPHTFSAGKKPFTVAIDFKNGSVVNGRSVEKKGIRYWASFRKAVQVKKGDTFFWHDKNGFILNGKAHPVSTHPLKKSEAHWAWAPRRLRIAVHPEKDDTVWDSKARKVRKVKNPKTYWVAMDVRGYWLGCADTPLEAIKRLLDQVQFTDMETRHERRRGIKVVRWHCHKQKDVRKTLRESEEKAKKNGFILEGVDWKNSFFAKNMKTGSRT